MADEVLHDAVARSDGGPDPHAEPSERTTSTLRPSTRSRTPAADRDRVGEALASPAVTSVLRSAGVGARPRDHARAVQHRPLSPMRPPARERA